MITSYYKPRFKEVLKETWTQQQAVKRIQEIYVKYSGDGQKNETHIWLLSVINFTYRASIHWAANEIWPRRDHFLRILNAG